MRNYKYAILCTDMLGKVRFGQILICFEKGFVKDLYRFAEVGLGFDMFG